MKKGKIVYIIVAIVIILMCLNSIRKNNGSNIEEIKNNVVVLNEATDDPANEGKLILLTGEIKVDGITDEDLKVNFDSPLVYRSVEMYQYYVYGDNDLELDWTKDEGGNIVTNTYGDDMIDSTGRVIRNPEKPLDDETFTCGGKIGDFTIDESILSQINVENVTYETDEDTKVKFDGDTYYFNDGYFNTCFETGREIAGDIRIKYSYKDMSDVETITVLGVQSSKTIEMYTSKNGSKIYACKKGEVTLDSILETLEKNENRSNKISIAIILIVIIIGFFVLKNKKENAEEIENESAKKKIVPTKFEKLETNTEVENKIEQEKSNDETISEIKIENQTENKNE